MQLQKSSKSSLKKESTLCCVVIALLAISCIFPLYIVLVNSFSTEEAIIRNGYSFWPKEMTLDSYKFMINTKGKLLFRSLGVSVIVTVLGTLYTMFVTVCYGYAISQDTKVFPLANKLSFFAWFTTVFTGGVIPWYILCTQYYGIYNNIFALFVPYGLNVFNMFIIRNSFRQIPKELTESAKLDGASNLRIFVNIAIPLAKVGIVTVVLFTAMMYWNDFYLSVYLISKSEYYPLQKLLYSLMSNVKFLTSGFTSEMLAQISLPNNTAKLIITILSIFPVAVIFPFTQKFFVKGITVGAVKG